jgi:hypothetical protein
MASVSRARLLAKMLPANATTIYERVSPMTTISRDLFWDAIDVARTNPRMF